jgi:hypothetical protein
MTTDVGHRLRRRGRKGGAKRRTPRAAVAAGALAAASIPLWGAVLRKADGHGFVFPPHQETEMGGLLMHRGSKLIGSAAVVVAAGGLPFALPTARATAAARSGIGTSR